MMQLSFNPFGRKKKTGNPTEDGGMPPLLYSPGEDALWHHPAIADLFFDGCLPAEISARLGVQSGLESLSSSLAILDSVMTSPAMSQGLQPQEAALISKARFPRTPAMRPNKAWGQEPAKAAYACRFPSAVCILRLLQSFSIHRIRVALHPMWSSDCPREQVAAAFSKCVDMAKKMPGHSLADKAGVALVEAEEAARRAAVAAGGEEEPPVNLPAFFGHHQPSLVRHELTHGAPGVASVASASGQLMTEAAGGGRDESLVRMIGRVVERVKALGPSDIVIIPAGWERGDEAKDDQIKAHCLLVVVGREQGPSGALSVSVCNIGEGSDYHAGTATRPSATRRTTPLSQLTSPRPRSAGAARGRRD